MDIVIPDSWLREFLKTKATPATIAKYLSLCGPSVERISKKGKEHIYQIEITTNRVDSAGIYGFAREAAAILPRFNIKAKLAHPRYKSNQQFVSKVDYLKAKVDHHLCQRFTAVLIRGVVQKDSPDWVKKRLISIGLRPINNIVDISNYIMHELAQPVHIFDYDKIQKKKMILRASKRGEKLVTLDGKKHLFKGNDIVIEDGGGRLIDLAGIMGGLNSAVDNNTKNVLLFVQTYNPKNIRKTSMSLAQRSEAASLFEKSLDPELVTLGIRRGIDLFVQLIDGKPESKILDIYPEPYNQRSITVEKSFIDQYMGVKLEKKEIANILNSLEFKTKWEKNRLIIQIPSYRSNDVNIPQDIVEEVARIYGYHNLPSLLMEGGIPEPLANSSFAFEKKVKEILKGDGGVEIYTNSLVPKEYVSTKALKLKNPLGSDTQYLRTSLMPSLENAAKDNINIKDSFHLFEMANVYLKRKNNLPEERLMLAGIFSNYSFRKAKGVIESLLKELNIKYTTEVQDGQYYNPSQRLVIKAGNIIGEFGILENNDFIHYQFGIDKLFKASSPTTTFKQIPKFPAQIEDITLTIPERTRVGEVIQAINVSSKLIERAKLTDTYKDAYTFRVWFQHPTKTLTNKEVEKIRRKTLKVIKSRLGGIIKT